MARQRDDNRPPEGFGGGLPPGFPESGFTGADPRLSPGYDDAAVRKAELEAQGEIVETDLLCANCGYNVKGISVAGHCPECGIDVQMTITGDLLSRADAAWLRRMAFGGRMLGCTAPGLALLGLTSPGLLVSDVGRLTLGGVASLFGLFAGAAMLVMTKREPGRLRWRLAMLLGVGAGGATILTALLNAVVVAAGVANVAAAGAGVVVTLIVLCWIAAIGIVQPTAKRGIDMELHYFTIGFLLFAAAVLLPAAVVVAGVGVPVIGPNMSTLIAGSYLIWAAGVIFMCQWSAVLLFQYAQLLMKAARGESLAGDAGAGEVYEPDPALR